MSGEREDEGERLAGFIVGALRDADVLGATDIQRASAIAAEEITVFKAMGAYWCSWCSLKPEVASGVQTNDEAISFAADGLTLKLKRLRRVEPSGRIALEIQVRAGAFGGRYETEISIDELLRFVSELRAAEDPQGEIHTATLRSAPNEAALELTVNAGPANGRYLFRAQKRNGVSAELSGSFVADSAILATLARELRSLVHESWAERSGT
jgi:hypothetical protein